MSGSLDCGRRRRVSRPDRDHSSSLSGIITGEQRSIFRSSRGRPGLPATL